tara:strand:- start:29 stop:400 length:372 start_codon:yes stop_codon:yes gene_type:complete
MSDESFEKGLQKRKKVLGEEYVQKNLDNADDFSLPFQKMLTEICWDWAWNDEVIPDKTRSMLNLTMLAGQKAYAEFEIHCRGALNNNVTREELRAILHIISVYCGVPTAVECFKIARKVLEEK